jgi:arylsulfatase A-like enzyme
LRSHFVVQTDDCVGRVLATLEQAGVAENTLVIFTSDNGPETADEFRRPHSQASARRHGRTARREA